MDIGSVAVALVGALATFLIVVGLLWTPEESVEDFVRFQNRLHSIH